MGVVLLQSILSSSSKGGIACIALQSKVNRDLIRIICITILDCDNRDSKGIYRMAWVIRGHHPDHVRITRPRPRLQGRSPPRARLLLKIYPLFKKYPFGTFLLLWSETLHLRVRVRYKNKL